MPLEEVEKKLYGKESEKPAKKTAKKEAAVPQFGPWADVSALPAKPKKVEPSVAPPTPAAPSVPKKPPYLLIGIAAGAALLITAGIGFYFWYVYFPQNQVEITLTGPKEVRAGDTVIYSVHYKNNTRTVLNDAELYLRYPEGVILLDSVTDLPFAKKTLGNIGIGSEAEETFSLMFLGESLSTRHLEAALSYRPANLPRSNLENTAVLDVTISALSLNLDLFLPNKVVPSEPFKFTIHYKNNSDENFADARIEVDYPDKFTFLDSGLRPTENQNVWSLGTLGANSEGDIEVKGAVAGQESVQVEFRGRIGVLRKNEFLVFRETKSQTMTIGLPLQITSVVNDTADYVAKAGETLTYRIRYKNTSTIGLKEVILKTEFIGAMFDFRTLEIVSGGAFSNNAIIWNAGNWPAFAVLESGQEGEVGFKIRLLDDYPVRTAADKNFVLKVRSTIETETVPAYVGLLLKKISVSTETATRVMTDIRLAAKGYFRDPKGYIVNSGPLPPRVGQTTTFTIAWLITNPANELENVIVKSSLPAGVAWTGKVVLPFGSVAPVYNERAGEVTWNLSRIPAGAGITSPVYEVYFQVAATPSIKDVNSFIKLMGETQYSGRDVFTAREISGRVLPILSNVPDDTTMGPEMGVVKE